MRKLILVLVLLCLATSAVATSIVPIVHPDAGSSTIIVPPTSDAIIVVTDPPPPVLQELKNLQQRYEELKANTDKSAKMLLIAGTLAAGLKLLLSGVALLAGRKPKRWLALVALGLAIPIALLSHFAAGHSWFDSMIYAGAGPGAIVVHEVMKLFAKSKEAA